MTQSRPKAPPPDVLKHNREAWNRYVEGGIRWSVPVTPEAIAAARRGEFELFLTPTRPVPLAWFPPLPGCRTLCLASGGGQQGPLLAAAGARVTVFDNSPRQLEQDRKVAERDGLPLELAQGDMADLGRFEDGCFDLVVHPVSNTFTPDVRKVWREACRVLRPGGVLLSGFTNPAAYLFDETEAAAGRFVVVHPLPYSDVEALDTEHQKKRMAQGEALEFSHTLGDQLGGQTEAGFVLTALFEDTDPSEPLSKYFPLYMATRAQRPER